MGPFGSNIKTDCFVSSGVPVLNGNNISTFLLVENEFRYVEPQKALELRNSIAHSGDIVITHRGTLGQAALIPDRTKYKEYVISQSQFLLTCDRDTLIPEYLLFYFHTPYGKRALLANDNTTGVPSIAKPTTYIKSLRVPIPPMKYQKKWRELANTGLMYISNNNSEIEMMETAKRALLEKII